jgi:hypothetical protein
LIFGVAVPFLNQAFELVAISVDYIEVIVCEPTLLLLHLSFELLPVSFDSVPIHCVLLVSVQAQRAASSPVPNPGRDVLVER